MLGVEKIHLAIDSSSEEKKLTLPGERHCTDEMWKGSRKNCYDQVNRLLKPLSPDWYSKGSIDPVSDLLFTDLLSSLVKT